MQQHDGAASEVNDYNDVSLIQSLDFNYNWQLNDKEHKKPKSFKSFWFDPSEEEVYIRVRWHNIRAESNHKLSEIMKDREFYLEDLIAWILRNINSDTNTNDKRTKDYIDSIWLSTKCTIPIGTIVELQNKNDYDGECKYGVVDSHISPEQQFDFEWNLHKHKNMIFLPLNMNKTIMMAPTMSEENNKCDMTQCDVERVNLENILSDSEKEVNVDSLPFVQRYLLLKLMLSKETEKKLARQKYRAERTAKETTFKQLEIMADRANAVIQRRKNGDTVTICVDFNANMYLLYTKQLLAENNLDVNKRGYIYTCDIPKDKTKDVFGAEAELCKIKKPNPKTFCNGWKLDADVYRLIWSNYSLKARLRFTISKKTLKLKK